MVSLQVFITNDCWTCEEARRVAADMSAEFSQVAVELVEDDPNDWPSTVFAVPTYLLDGRVLFLGNPTRHQLRQKLAIAIAGSQP